MVSKNRKRNRASIDDSPSESKRHRGDSSPRQSYTQGRLDPTFGQRSAIPGLDDEGDEDVEYGDMDALAYLRSVRQEATLIPTILTAPQSTTHSIYTDGTGDSRGHYGDGAYIAAPSSPSRSSASAHTTIDAQSAYFSSIATRLQSLRAKLSSYRPAGAPAAPPTSNASWRWKLRNTDPSAAEMARMEKGSVLRVLRMISTSNEFMARGREVDLRLSAWVWSLLGRLPDVGELGSEEVGVVRELGKRAVWVGVGFKDARSWGGDEGMVEVEREVWGEEEGGDDGGAHDAEMDVAAEEDIETVRARLLSRIAGGSDEVTDDSPENHPPPQPEAEAPTNPSKEDPPAPAPEIEPEPKQVDEEAELPAITQDTAHPTKNTRATLDMIITIAGELYGQRDLLEFREVWD